MAQSSTRAGLALIKQFEGCKLTSYPDPATGAQPWTIGYGHTGNIHPHETITQAQADVLLLNDYDRFEAQVRALLKVVVTQNQLGALVSFAFNVGIRNLSSSTLLRKLNAGDAVGAALEFVKWNRAAGKVMRGLTTRRAAETRLFQS
jgi:lysozyme